MDSIISAVKNFIAGRREQRLINAILSGKKVKYTKIRRESAKRVVYAILEGQQRRDK